MKKVVRYVSRLLDSHNRQLLNQYLGALHGRLEHEWLPGDSKATDVVFVQTRHQLGDLPEGAKPIAFMPREGSTVGEKAAVIDRPHLMQTFARNLNRSAGEALVHPPAQDSYENKSEDVDYIAHAWERAANSSAWPEFVDSVTSSKQTQPASAPLAVLNQAQPHLAEAIQDHSVHTRREMRRNLTPLLDYTAGLVTAYTSAAECVEHAKRMGWPLVTIVAPQGWRVFIDVAANKVFTRNAASRPFSGHARFLSVLKGACQVMPLSRSSFEEETQGIEPQTYQRFCWELGLALTERLLPWLPSDGLITVHADRMPQGITLHASHTQAMHVLAKGPVVLSSLERLRAPRHAMIGLVNALELSRAMSITALPLGMPKVPPSAPIFLRVPEEKSA